MLRVGRREGVSFLSPIRGLERLDNDHYDNEENNKSGHNLVPVIEIRSLCMYHLIYLHGNPMKLDWL